MLSGSVSAVNIDFVQLSDYNITYNLDYVDSPKGNLFGTFVRDGKVYVVFAIESDEEFVADIAIDGIGYENDVLFCYNPGLEAVTSGFQRGCIVPVRGEGIKINNGYNVLAIPLPVDVFEDMKSNSYKIYVGIYTHCGSDCKNLLKRTIEAKLSTSTSELPKKLFMNETNCLVAYQPWSGADTVYTYRNALFWSVCNGYRTGIEKPNSCNIWGSYESAYYNSEYTKYLREINFGAIKE